MSWDDSVRPCWGWHVQISDNVLKRLLGCCWQLWNIAIFGTGGKWTNRYNIIQQHNTGWWYTFPSETYESQLGWLDYSQYMDKKTCSEPQTRYDIIRLDKRGITWCSVKLMTFLCPQRRQQFFVKVMVQGLERITKLALRHLSYPPEHVGVRLCAVCTYQLQYLDKLNYLNKLNSSGIKGDDSPKKTHNLWWGRSEVDIVYPDILTTIYGP